MGLRLRNLPPKVPRERRRPGKRNKLGLQLRTRILRRASFHKHPMAHLRHLRRLLRRHGRPRLPDIPRDIGANA